MKQAEIDHAWNEVTGRLEDPMFTLPLVGFTAGFLLGGEQARGAVLLIAMAEKLYGGGGEVFNIKRKMGLAGSVSGDG